MALPFFTPPAFRISHYIYPKYAGPCVSWSADHADDLASHIADGKYNPAGEIVPIVPFKRTPRGGIDLAVEWDQVKENPAKDIRKHKQTPAREVFLSEKEVKRFLAVVE